MVAPLAEAVRWAYADDFAAFGFGDVDQPCTFCPAPLTGRYGQNFAPAPKYQ